MTPSRFRRILAAALAAAAVILAPARPALAEIADVAQVPLANSPSDAVLPNLMYVLDDSGSMPRPAERAVASGSARAHRRPTRW